MSWFWRVVCMISLQDAELRPSRMLRTKWPARAERAKLTKRKTRRTRWWWPAAASSATSAAPRARTRKPCSSILLSSSRILTSSSPGQCLYCTTSILKNQQKLPYIRDGFLGYRSQHEVYSRRILKYLNVLHGWNLKNLKEFKTFVFTL